MLKILFHNEDGKNFVMYLKQTNLENRLYVSESLKEDFNDTVFQNLVVELFLWLLCNLLE